MQFLSTRFFVNKETGRWESERFIIRNWLTWLWRLISPKIHSWEGSWEGDFPGSAVAKTPCSQCRDPGSITGQGPRSPMLFPNFGFQMFNYDVSCTVPVWVQAWRQGKIDVSAWTLSGKEKTNSPYSVLSVFPAALLEEQASPTWPFTLGSHRTPTVSGVLTLVELPPPVSILSCWLVSLLWPCSLEFIFTQFSF